MRLECTVHGRVQMVMFRDFTRRTARSLGLTGTVKNNPDGTVDVAAEGDGQALAELLEKLKKGSLFSRVEKVDEAWKDATGKFSDFTIIQ